MNTLGVTSANVIKPDLMYMGGRYQCHPVIAQPLHGVVFPVEAERSLNYDGD